MIVTNGIVENETATILDKLRASKFIFNLTGSRYFGYDTPTSDYDYFTMENEECLEFLESLGFSRIVSSRAYPNDPFIASLYSLGAIHIQVISKDKLDAKIQAQRLIFHANLGYFLYGNNKKDSKLIWEVVMSIACYQNSLREEAI